MAATAPAVHGQWSSRLAFLFATIGYSVGLGNIWRFPWLAGENGGGAFVLIYIFCVAAIALPILMAELMIGRRGGLSPMASLVKLARAEGKSAGWGIGGAIAVLTTLVIGTFYGVIGGWTLAYSWKAATGALSGLDTEAAQGLFGGFLASPIELAGWMLLFLAINALIVGRGIKAGIEKATGILMPLLFLMLIGLVLWAMVAGDAAAALRFLFAPDFSDVTAQTWVDAIGQAFFSVSVGAGGMMVYGAYLQRDVKIAPTAATVAAADTAVAILAGLAIFPFLFAQGLAPAQGPGLMFVVMPVALQATGVPGLIAFLFFALLAIAAITSMLALFETAIAVTEEWGWHRERTIWAIAGGTGFVGLTTVLSFNRWADVHPLAFLPGFETRTPFDIADWFASNIGLTTAALISALFAGWVLSRANAADELGVSPDSAGFRLWRFLVRVPVPIAVAVLLGAALFGWGETTG